MEKVIINQRIRLGTGSSWTLNKDIEHLIDMIIIIYIKGIRN